MPPVNHVDAQPQFRNNGRLRLKLFFLGLPANPMSETVFPPRPPEPDRWSQPEKLDELCRVLLKKADRSSGDDCQIGETFLKQKYVLIPGIKKNVVFSKIDHASTDCRIEWLFFLRKII